MDQQIKSVGILQAFDHFKGDRNRRAVFVIAGMTMLNKAEIDIFAFTAFNLFSDPARCPQPLFTTFFAGITFYDEIVSPKFIEVFRRIVSAVETDQALPVDPQLFVIRWKIFVLIWLSPLICLFCEIDK